MKKVILYLIAAFGLTPIIGQVEEQPPKIIIEIDKRVREIDSLTLINTPIIDYDSSSSLHWEKTFIWVIDNHVKKISSVGRLQHGNVLSHEFYYNQEQVILSKSGELKKFQPSSNFSGKPIQNDTLTEIFYYDYNETISNPQLLIIEKDTLFWDVEMLKLGYSLYDKYKPLQNFNPFDSLVYDKVVAYDFDGKDGREIVMDGTLVKDAKNPKTMTKVQTQSLLQTITDTASYGYGSPGYFEQTIGIVFYNNKKIAAHISISFDANSLKSSIYLPATQYYFDIVDGDDYYTRNPIQGFSPQARKQLRKLCGELGLKNYPTKDGIWDEE